MMILNIWDSIRNFFIKLFDNFSLSFIIYLLLGIIIGLLIGVIIYFSLLHASKKKNKKKQEEVIDPVLDSNNSNLVYKIIEDTKNDFKNKVKEYSASQKFSAVSNFLLDMAKEIAFIYFPNEKDKDKALLEVNLDEALDMIRRMDRTIDNFLERYFFTRLFKKKKIKLIPDMIEKNSKKQDKEVIENHGFFRNAFKAIVDKAKTPFMGIFNSAISKGLEYLFNIFFDVIGVEVAKTYSRGHFIERVKGKQENDEEIIISEVEVNE